MHQNNLEHVHKKANENAKFQIRDSFFFYFTFIEVFVAAIFYTTIILQSDKIKT